MPSTSPAEGAPLLQFADAVAFAARHYLSGHKEGLWLMQELTGFEDPEPMFAPHRDKPGAEFCLNWSGQNRYFARLRGRWGEIDF